MEKKTKELSIVEMHKQVSMHFADPGTVALVLAIPFKGLTEALAKQAAVEGMMRGYSWQDFLKKNLYAIPFKNKQTQELTYSLVTSIDHARKIGARSGVVGKSKPEFKEDDKGVILSCEITIKKKAKDGYVGEYTALVYFKEYNTGYQQWASKPHTMIAKVAEMHALRMACPEELSQAYTEEEYDLDTVKAEIKANAEAATKTTEDGKDVSLTPAQKLEATKSYEELKTVFSNLTATQKVELNDLKNKLKDGFLARSNAIDGKVVDEPVKTPPDLTQPLTEAETDEAVAALIEQFDGTQV